MAEAQATMLRSAPSSLPGGLSAAELSLADPRWLGFVRAHPDACPFHHPAWGMTIAASYGYEPLVLALLDGAGRIAAGLPLLDVRSALTGRRRVALPFTDHCTPLVRDEAALQELARALVAARRREGLPRIEVHAPLPERPEVHLGCSAVLHTLPLTGDADALFRSLRKTQYHRKITKAEREGVVIRRGESRGDLETFYRLHLQTRRRQGTPIQPRRFFDALWSRLIEPGLGFVLLAYHGVTPIAGAVFLTWRETVIYKYGASDPAYWGLRPNNLLMWTAIRGACEEGAVRFDFGKTDLANRGLRDFKAGWGARETPLVSSVIAAAPPRRGEGTTQRLLGAFIRRTPPVACRLAGELLYRHVA